MSARDQKSWGSLSRGEQVALLLRLGVLAALAVTLVRAFLAFMDLVETRDLPLRQLFYVPAAMVAAFALTARLIVQIVRRVGKKGDPPGRPD